MKIKYEPTNIIYDLPESECLRLLAEDRANFFIINEVKNVLQKEKKEKVKKSSVKE